MDCYDVICFAVATSDGTSIYHPGFETVRAIDTATGNELWLELHSKQDATPEWFRGWCGRVPEYGPCGCRNWLKDYLAENPPRYDDWPRWTWEVHNAVNLKLNKPIISLKEAYGSYSITK